jgi:hypothetical protein
MKAIWEQKYLAPPGMSRGKRNDPVKVFHEGGMDGSG